MPRITILLFFLLAFPGCGPRLEVARDRVLTQIDGLLGEIELRRKETDLALQQAEAILSHLKKGRIEVQARSFHISQDLTSTHDRLAQTDRALSRLKDLLAQDQPVQIAGTTYTSTQLRGMASRTISTRRSLAAQAETLQRTQDRRRVDLQRGTAEAGDDRIWFPGLTFAGHRNEQ